MNFAPYAPPPDEHRPSPKSPPKRTLGSSTASHPPSSPWPSQPHDNDAPSQSYQYGPSALDNAQQSSYYSASSSSTQPPQPGPSHSASEYFLHSRSGRQFASPEAYETRFGWRVDILSALAYCTPLMGMVMLMVESRNDFVRIHAYQSLFLALPLGFLHLLLLASHFLQVVLFLVDLGLYGWLGYQAYFDAEVLERKLLPILGPLAERWTEEE